MVDVELTRKQVDLMFAALKHAESKLTELGLFDACVAVSELHDSLFEQIHSFEKVEG